MKNKKIFKTSFYILIITLLFSGCQLLPDEDERLYPPIVEQPKVVYKYEEVKYGNVSTEIDTYATFKAVNPISCKFEHVSGSLEKIYVEVGDEVKAGDIIAMLEMEDIDKSIRDMEIALERARLSFNRTTEKYNNNEISLYDLEIAELQFQNTQNLYNDLMEEYNSNILLASVDGIVSYVSPLEPEDTVSKNQLVAKIIDGDGLVLEANSSKAYKFKVNTTVELSSRAGDTSGIITKITGSKITISPDVIMDSWKLNTTVHVKQTLESSEGTLIINSDSVYNYGTSFIAKILVDGYPMEIAIEVGIIGVDYVEVLSGLEEGDLAVLY